MSKGLESLKKIKETNSYMIQIQGKCVCVPYYDDIEKELKALEILKPFIELETFNDNGYDVFFLKIGKERIEISMKQFLIFNEVLDYAKR